ncbi:hypothetical protein LCGC14_0295540 [marine sediment metagenome]|uniref:Uncharacterized protein n=1 Tax=marine sediment metagenome TaxID=412755 RepID=A0A0F9WDI0_9ZZZZ
MYTSNPLPIEFLYNEHGEDDNGKKGHFFSVARIEINSARDSLTLNIPVPGLIPFTRDGWEELTNAVKQAFEEEEKDMIDILGLEAAMRVAIEQVGATKDNVRVTVHGPGGVREITKPIEEEVENGEENSE